MRGSAYARAYIVPGRDMSRQVWYVWNVNDAFFCYRMGVSKQSKNWSVTWKKQEDQEPMPVTDIHGTKVTVGAYSFVLTVGPVEETDPENRYEHQHMMVHCLTAAVSKTKVREAICEYMQIDMETCIENIMYIEYTRDKRAYIEYMFKELHDRQNEGKDDRTLKGIIEELKTKGQRPNVNRVKQELIKRYGGTTYLKRFERLTKVYMLETDIVDGRGKPTVEIDRGINRRNWMYNLLCFETLLTQTEISTLCKTFVTLNQKVLKEMVSMITLLPFFTNRVNGHDDEIPSLYLWGVEGAGKTSLFNNSQHMKKVASDSQGVARFKMDNNHTGLLIDDVNNDYLYQKENSSTLKQLATGGKAEIKVTGDTREIQAFIVITSNEEPIHMREEEDACFTKTSEQINIETVRRSWARRFMTVKFDTACPFDGKSVMFHDMELRDMAALTFRMKYEKLQELCQTEMVHDDVFNGIKNKFRVYATVAYEDYMNPTSMRQWHRCWNAAHELMEETMKEMTNSKFFINGWTRQYVWERDSNKGVQAIDLSTEEVVTSHEYEMMDATQTSDTECEAQAKKNAAIKKIYENAEELSQNEILKTITAAEERKMALAREKANHDELYEEVDPNELVIIGDEQGKDLMAMMKTPDNKYIDMSVNPPPLHKRKQTDPQKSIIIKKACRNLKLNIESTL